MKSTENFQLDRKWWSKGKPMTLKSTGLGEALGQYEAAKTAAEDRVQRGDYKDFKEDPFDAALSALNEVETAVAKATKMCNKTLHSDCITVLGKSDGVIKAARKKIEELREDFVEAYEKMRAPMFKTAVESHDLCVELKKKALTSLKAAEESNKSLEGLYRVYLTEVDKGTFSGDAAAIIVKEMADEIGVIKQSFELASRFATDSSDAHSAVKDGTGALTKAHVEDQVKLKNICSEIKNAVTEVRDKIRLITVECATLFKEVKAAEQNQTIAKEKYLKRLTDLRTAMNEVHESARKQSNTLIPWGDTLGNIHRAILKFKQQGAKWQAVNTVTAPPDQWKARATEYMEKAPPLALSTQNLAKQAESLVDKTLNAIPKDLFNDKKFQGIKEEILSKVNGVKNYASQNVKGQAVVLEKGQQILDEEENL